MQPRLRTRATMTAVVAHHEHVERRFPWACSPLMLGSRTTTAKELYDEGGHVRIVR